MEDGVPIIPPLVTSLKYAFDKFALSKLTLVITAFVKVTAVNVAPVKMAPFNVALVKFAPFKFAFLKFAFSSDCPEKS